MSNTRKKGINIAKVKELWRQGRIQKTTRITYEVVWNIFLAFIIIGVISLFFAGGVGAGYFASLVKDVPMKDKQAMSKEIYNYSSTSELYFANDKYLGRVRSDLHREEVALKDISDYLKNAVIATEDENFHTHDGVVPKAVMRAVFQEITNAATKTGGSTLTQQLVKNQILTNEVSFERKAKEMLIALRVERFFEKDEILEAYLNMVPFGRNANGRNIAGIQTAAQGIFNVDASNLSLPQAAFLAGLPQNPYVYTPFKNNGEVKSKEGLQPGLYRMQDVLGRMLEAGYITEEEYKKASEYDITKDFAKPSDSPIEKYPYLTFEIEERAIEIIMEMLVKQDGYTMEDLENNDKLRQEYRQNAERELRTGGYEIHSTIHKKMYDVAQKVKNNYQRYGPSITVPKKDENWENVTDEDGNVVYKELPVQVGGMVIQNETGRILSFIGGRDYDISQVNHATSALRSNGSTMKPLLVYGPGIDMGVLHPGSVIADVPYEYPGTNKDVNNYNGQYVGFTSVRYALKESLNVPAVKAYTKIVNRNPAKKYLEKMGITSLTPDDYTNYSAAIGSPTVTIEENTNAYTTFGNMGKFVDAYMIEKIVDSNGDVVYEHKSEPVDVFSQQASYLTIDMMRDVLSTGSASNVNLKYSGVDWAGKTGTSQYKNDTWFVATNPNVTVSTWMGYSRGGGLQTRDYSSRNSNLWAQVVNAISDVNPEIMVPEQNFKRPEGIVTRSYCATSGLKPSELCSKVGLVEQDLYWAKYAPDKVDDSLISGSFVQVKDKLVVAGPNTPSEFINKGGGVTISPEFLKENNLNNPEILSELIPSSWDNVALPSGAANGVTTSIENDGAAPAAPGGVSANGSSLSWSASPSSDVVGYRVYRSSSAGGSFNLIGSTAGTNYNFSGGDGYYAVRAVDYFGMSSALSSPVKIGTPGAPAKPAKPAKPANPPEESPTEKPETDKPENEGNDEPTNGDEPGQTTNEEGNDTGSESTPTDTENDQGQTEEKPSENEQANPEQ
ncbi:transglycosylase domain-containing protein [Thalassobacillus pellis]|uniref:transglycosylase domain-containing protein n=1 Tax=Thalassobacillus pellis TaxID=748008 RepID=UPI0019607194|nr:transglycosylase domain-containing protein [Thalassobacillus pellis]MBM7554941.1 penicillin-binding protein [Thalassobacillus pellis]